MAQRRVTDLTQISQITDSTRFYAGEQIKDYQCSGAQLKTYFGTQSIADRLQALEDRNQKLEDSFIGSIQTFSSNTLPEEYLSCDGAEYLKADYPKLYAKIGDVFSSTELGYTAPTDADHFRVPNLLDQFIRNTDGTKALGTQQTDTMRKIIGEFNLLQGSRPYYSIAYDGQGALTVGIYNSGTYTNGYQTQSNGANQERDEIMFDSSKGIEGQEGTASPNVGVETAPKHTVLIFAIKAK